VYELSKDQVDFILEDVRRNGIKTEELQLSLLDHICCVIENEMSPDKNFDEFYRSVLPRFFKKELKEIQEETDLLLTFKHYYAMKKVMLRSGMFSAITFAIGAIFKIMHWPGASAMLVFAIFISSFIFLPLFFIIKSKEVKATKEKFIIGFGVIFGILFSISTIFKIMHWPGAHLLWLVCLGVLFFLFLPLFFFSGIRNPETKMNTILSSIMILVAGGLLFTLTALQSGLNGQEALRIADQQIKVVGQNVQLASENKYQVSISDSVNENLKNRVNEIIKDVEKTRSGLYTYLSDGKKFSEKELIEAYYGNYQLPGMYFFQELNGNVEDDKLKPHLLNLKKQLIDFKRFIELNYSKKQSDILNLNDDFRTYKSGIKKVSWEYLNFHATPMEVIVRNFDQLVLDIRIIEASCIK